MSRYENVDELWKQAEREELRKVIAVLPDPKRVAESLREASLLALINAERTKFGDYMLLPSQRRGATARELVEAGVVEVGGVFIGTFGMKVRREAIAMQREGLL